jgi:2-polyprenyl-3-methyl-5-hydroxy-6-metoxy-1,4-benzoquinol methylase
MTVNQQATSSSSIPCNLCDGKEVSILSNRSRSGKPLRTVICQACGLVWSDPRPHDVRQFYEEEYRLSYKHTYSPKPKHVLRAGHVALSRFDKIEQLLSSRKAVLDVGTGGGEFAYLLQSLGHSVSGIEPNRGYAGYSIHEYGLTVQVGFVKY